MSKIAFFLLNFIKQFQTYRLYHLIFKIYAPSNISQKIHSKNFQIKNNITNEMVIVVIELQFIF